MDRLTHSRSRGFGFITFDAVEVAKEAAVQQIFSFGDRMVEIKRAQNLNANRNKQQKEQQQLCADSARAKFNNKPQVAGRGNGTGRGGMALLNVTGRGVKAALRGSPMGNQQGVTPGLMPRGANQGAPMQSPHQYPNAPSDALPMQGKYRGMKCGGGPAVWRPGMPNWAGPTTPHFPPGMVPEAYNAQPDRMLPTAAGARPMHPAAWFPGMMPPEAPEAYAPGAYAYFYPVYPSGRGGGMGGPGGPCMPQAPHGPYTTQWQGPEGMMPQFFAGGPHGGVFYGPIQVPPGIDMGGTLMYGMHPGFMGMQPPEDYQEPQGTNNEEDRDYDDRDDKDSSSNSGATVNSENPA